MKKLEPSLRLSMDFPQRYCDQPISLSGQKVSLQWRKHAIAMHKYTTIIDLAKPCFWECLPMLLETPTHAFGELLVKTSKTYNLFI
jgi:hypothetical protein